MTVKLRFRYDPDQKWRAFRLPGMKGIDQVIALPGPEGSPGISVNNKDLDLISDLEGKIKNIVINQSVAG